MEVLIVSKTQMTNNHVCVGGVEIHNLKSVRLLEAGRHNPFSDTPYSIGDIWDFQYNYCESVEPPHVEDVIIQDKRLMSKNNSVIALVGSKISPWCGKPDVLFDGNLSFTSTGKGYVSEKGKRPDHSTGFWISDKTLQMQTNAYNGRHQYYYHDSLGNRVLPYVGIETPINFIPQGTLLRVSLARWWRPEDSPDEELRCYLQLSGFYNNHLEGKPEIAQPVAEGLPQSIAKEHSPTTTQMPHIVPSDYGLYECINCSKRVLGFDQAQHVKEIHAGKSMEWKKIR
ncbi:MAG: hypothetical protein WCK35_15290 [Chloroflexota bacterium]